MNINLLCFWCKNCTLQEKKKIIKKKIKKKKSLKSSKKPEKNRKKLIIFFLKMLPSLQLNMFLIFIFIYIQ